MATPGPACRAGCEPTCQANTVTSHIEGEQGGISETVGWQGGGGYRFFELGPRVFTEAGHIDPDIRFDVLAAHIWFSETKTPWHGGDGSPFLGVHDGVAYALLYNGVLKDRSARGGNALTRDTLAIIRNAIAEARPDVVAATPLYPLVVYGTRVTLAASTLAQNRITFKQIPYEVTARR